MNAPITYQTLTPTEARDSIEHLKAVYGAVFSQPPYNEEPHMVPVFAEAVDTDSRQPGFTMVVAWCERTPVGFAYGYTIPKGAWRWPTDQPTPPELAAVPKFTVMEWAVLPECRGQGIGRTLMHALLATRPERWSVLTVHPDAEARVIYERAGWRHIASTTPTEHWPSMNVMVLDRTPTAEMRPDQQ